MTKTNSTNEPLALLGLKVCDKVSGMTGIVESICFDLYGCVQAVVRPPVDEKGALPEGRWFDVSRLNVLDWTPIMEVPGGRFTVDRSRHDKPRAVAAGPAEKPAR